MSSSHRWQWGEWPQHCWRDGGWQIHWSDNGWQWASAESAPWPSQVQPNDGRHHSQDDGEGSEDDGDSSQDADESSHTPAAPDAFTNLVDNLERAEANHARALESGVLWDILVYDSLLSIALAEIMREDIPGAPAMGERLKCMRMFFLARERRIRDATMQQVVAEVMRLDPPQPAASAQHPDTGGTSYSSEPEH